MDTSENQQPNQRNSVRSLLETWELIYKELLFLDCAHLADEVAYTHKRISKTCELDDLRQDARTQLWELIDLTVKQPKDFKRTARTAIDSHLKDSRRSSTSKSKLIDKFKSLGTTDVTLSPDQRLEQQEVRHILNEACSSLGQREFEVLSKLTGLGDFDKLEVTEVAAQERVSRQTINNWKKKAYRQLRQNPDLQDLAS